MIRRGKNHPLKMDGWKMVHFLFWGKFALFSGAFFAVSFREGLAPPFLGGLFAYTPWNPCSPRSSRDVMWHLMWWFETFPPSLPVVSKRKSRQQIVVWYTKLTQKYEVDWMVYLHVSDGGSEILLFFLDVATA